MSGSSEPGSDVFQISALPMFGPGAGMRKIGSMVLLLMIVLVGVGSISDGATNVSVTLGTVTPTSAAITWSQTQDTCFTEYVVFYKQDTASQWTQAASFANAATTSYTITGLSPGTAYEVRVRDTDCLGSHDSDARSFRTLGSAPGFEALATFGAMAVLVFVGLRRRS